MLVSEADVDNYKQIKKDLDDLRLLVEKSELWVYKSKTSSDGGKKKTVVRKVFHTSHFVAVYCRRRGISHIISTK